MRRRLRYFRLFAFMTVLLLVVGGIYRVVQRPSAPREPRPQASSPTPPQYAVIVAAQDLPPYTLLTPNHVIVRKMTTPPPDGAFSDPQQVAQRLTRVYIRTGEIVRLTDVTPPLRDGALANALPPGMVGISLPVTRREQVPPVRPGDALRIYAAFARTKVKPVAMRALVLAVDGSTLGSGGASAGSQSSGTSSGSSSAGAGTSNPPAPPGAPLTLLIAVPPDEARAIALALDSGATLYYALLPPPPLAPMVERSLSLRELAGLGGSEHPESAVRSTVPPAPSLPPPRRSQVRFVTPSPVVVSPTVPTRPAPPPLPAPDKPATSTPSQPMHQMFGVVGDRPVVLSVPVERKEGEP